MFPIPPRNAIRHKPPTTSQGKRGRRQPVCKGESREGRNIIKRLRIHSVERKDEF